ncbi:MAG: hypothetical protein ACJ79K_10010 [Gemmatimonadaceae bacterium]
MISPSTPHPGAGARTAADVAAAVAAFEQSADFPALIRTLQAIAAESDAESLVAAAEPYRDRPEVAGPLYERVIDLRPNDARALIALANAYWLHGRGGDVVGELASRAIAADPSQRAAWHLWALSEPDPRARVARWQQVADRFSGDDLARALLADNAASLAGAESDEHALALAIRTYEDLLTRAERPEQREALVKSITTLKSWSV